MSLAVLVGMVAWAQSADEAAERCRRHFQAGQLGAAAEACRIALSEREATLPPDDLRIAAAANDLGEVLDTAGRQDEAEALFVRALASLERTVGPDDPNVGVVLRNLALLRRSQGRLDEAAAASRRAVDVARTMGGVELASALVMHAETLQWRGDYAESVDALHSALDLVVQARGADDYDVALVGLRLGEALRLLGEPDEAEAHLQHAIERVTAVWGPDHPDVARGLDSLAMVRLATGRYAAAAELAERALAIVVDARGADDPDTISPRNTLAQARVAVGATSEAESLLRRNLAAVERAYGPDSPHLVPHLANVAGRLRDRGDLDEAIALYRRGLAIAQGSFGAEHPLTSSVLGNLARTLARTGALAEAETRFRESLAGLAAALPAGHPHVVEVSSNLAGVLEARGQVDEAERTYRQALAAAEGGLGPDHPTVAVVMQNLAMLLVRRGRLHEALAAHARALEIEESDLRRNLADVDPEHRRARLSAFAGSYTTSMSFALQWMPDDEQARRVGLSSLLRRKGRLLDLERRDLGRADAGVDVTIEAVAGTLSAGTALVELGVYAPLRRDAEGQTSWDEPHYGAFVLTPDAAIQAVDLGPTEAIDRAAGALRRDVVQRAPVEASARALFALTLGRLDLVGVEHLVLSPDGLMWLVPFGIVAPERDVVQVTSGRDRLRAPSGRDAGRPLVVAAVDYDEARRAGEPRGERPKVQWSPLEGAAEEGRRVARRLRRARLLRGAAATETALGQVRAPVVLHVASHGYFDREDAAGGGDASGQRGLAVRQEGPDLDPLVAVAAETDAMGRSGLVLAGANLPAVGADDGHLTAAEIANLDLDGTVLAVLSACETGFGEAYYSDGVHGLRRGLVLAGTRAQILALWRVDDRATLALMTALYRELGRGRTVGEALARAQAEVRGEPGWSHPWFWAAFTVSGDADARIR